MPSGVLDQIKRRGHRARKYCHTCLIFSPGNNYYFDVPSDSLCYNFFSSIQFFLPNICEPSLNNFEPSHYRSIEDALKRTHNKLPEKSTDKPLDNFTTDEPPEKSLDKSPDKHLDIPPDEPQDKSQTNPQDKPQDKI